MKRYWRGIASWVRYTVVAAFCNSVGLLYVQRGLCGPDIFLSDSGGVLRLVWRGASVRVFLSGPRAGLIGRDSVADRKRDTTLRTQERERTARRQTSNV